MGEHHHHLLHRHHETPPVEAVIYSEETQTIQESSIEHNYEKDVKHHKHMEHAAELGTVAAGAFALHEKHKAKKDPENAHRHKIEEEVAAAIAVGSGGFAFHEHHEKKEATKQEKEHHHRNF